MKCAVKDCENHDHEGLFVGKLCMPCHQFIAGDESLYSQAYRNVRYMIDAAVASEREACAKVCDAEKEKFVEQSSKNNGRDSDFAFGSVNSSERIAAAIRARGG